MLFTELKPLSRQQHRDLRLLPRQGYGFACHATELPIHASELRAVVPMLPLAFQLDGHHPPLVGLTGLHPRQSLMLSPKGAWRGIVVPEVLAHYPFTLVTQVETSEAVLCVDLACPRLSRDEGEPLMTPEGELMPLLTDCAAHLQRQYRERLAMDKAVRALAQAGLLRPWVVDGVATIVPDRHYVVDPAALKALPAAEQHALLDSGALWLAHAQIFSVANLNKLRMASARQSHQVSGIALGTDEEPKLSFDFD